MAMTALMLYCYKDNGHNIKYTSPMCCLFVVLAAIMYVDDTDLLFAASTPEESAIQFICKIQKGLND